MLQRGFQGTFDLLYLPIDFGTKKNRGFGFVNFFSCQHAVSFRDVFNGTQFTRYVTQKGITISPADTQGLALSTLCSRGSISAQLR